MAAVQPRPEKDFLTLEQAAEWYDVGYSSLRKMVKAKELTRHERPRDKRVWLSVDELEQRFRPKPVDG